jgi:hypothetical protein
MGALFYELINIVAHKREHKGHVEAVGPKGQYAAVAEEQGLYQQGDGHRDTG